MARAQSRPGRRTARPASGGGPPRLDRLSALIDRWAPPGGWIAAALVLLTLSAAAGGVFSLWPAGILVQTAGGTGGAAGVSAWSGRGSRGVGGLPSPPALRVVRVGRVGP